MGPFGNFAANLVELAVANIPTNIQLPASIPTQDPALAGFLSQLVIALSGWIVQVATAVNQLQQKK